MIEVFGDLWEYPTDIRVITTNGDINRSGRAVMGRGCALEAALKYPYLPITLANRIKQLGNTVCILGLPDPAENWWLVGYPVKTHYYEPATLELIRKSAHELVETTNYIHATCKTILGYGDDPLEVVLPRPGCGSGQLSWAEVKPVIEDVLDDRFKVITWK